MQTEASRTLAPRLWSRRTTRKPTPAPVKCDPWREGREYIEAQRRAGKEIDRRVLAEITGFLASTNTALIKSVLEAEDVR